MATAVIPLAPDQGGPVGTAQFAEFKTNAGTNLTTNSLAYDATTAEAAQWGVGSMPAYSSALVVKVLWYADTATTGAVVWAGSLRALTAADAQDTETDNWATENAASATNAPGTGQYLATTTITMTNADSVAAGDYVQFRLRRLPADAGDTMAGDAQVVQITIEYTTA